MKLQKIILLLFICSSLFGQTPDKTIVYGTVTSKAKDFEPFSYSGIMYEIYKSDGGWSSSISVDKNGFFKESFPKNAKLDLSTYYDNFYKSDTTIYTSLADSINVNFIIFPKDYIYTEQSAEKDISNGIVQLITFDSLIYNWNQKINFTKKFGFSYLLLSKPADDEFKENMDEYNWRVREYLNSINDSTWAEKLYKIKDSLIHIKADNYGKENEINLKELKFPDNAVLPKKMKRMIEEQKSDFQRLFGKNREKLKNYSPKFILDKIDNDSNYHYIFIAEYWMAFNYETMIPELIKRLTDKTEVGLVNTADLIIWERIQSGDLKFYGHGGVAFDDLFTVAGRANHLLRRITGEDFGSVSMYSTENDLKKLQNRWAYWLINIKKE